MPVTPISLSSKTKVPANTDALNAATLAPLFADLADRDYALANKVNELILALASTYVSVPVVGPKVALSAGASVVLANVKIPKGYKGAVISCDVYSSSGKASVAVYYTPNTFGGVGAGSGSTQLAITTTSSLVQSPWKDTGELVVVLANDAAGRQNISYSVLLGLIKA